MKKWLLLLIVIPVALIIWNSLSQPGPGDLKGNFKEVSFVRNEQNTGPVIRIYLVTVTDTVWHEMKIYGNYMPYNKYGNTVIYYFLASKPHPSQALLGDKNFDPQYNPDCIGVYRKGVMSQVVFEKYPYSAKD